MTNSKPTPHPHAELIKAWADGAKIESRYLIDFDNVEQWSKWTDDDSPNWCDEDYQFRIKPSNVPWKPENGGSYLYVNSCGEVFEKIWESSRIDEKHYENGNCFHHQDDAEATAERVIKAMKGTAPTSTYGSNTQLEQKYRNLYNEFVAAKKEIDELTSTPTLNGKPLTEGEKHIVQMVRNGDVVQLLSEGEKALIQALREVRIRGVFAEDSILSYIDDDGKLDSTGGVVAFDVSILTMKYNEQIRAALKQIKQEQEAQNEIK